MSEKKYSNKTRKPQSLIGKIAEHGNTAINTMSAMVVGAGVYGGKLMNDVRKFRNQQDKLRQKEHMKRFEKKRASRGGGGGGGIYNPAQPLADKNLMNKFGKKLK